MNVSERLLNLTMVKTTYDFIYDQNMGYQLYNLT